MLPSKLVSCLLVLIAPSASANIICPANNALPPADQHPKAVAQVEGFEVKYYDHVTRTPPLAAAGLENEAAKLLGGAIMGCGNSRKSRRVQMFEISRPDAAGFAISHNKARRLLDAFCGVQGKRSTIKERGGMLKKMERKAAHRYAGTCA